MWNEKPWSPGQPEWAQRRVAYLITDVQGEDDGQDAGRRVPPVAPQPAVKDVLDEGRVVDQDL